MSRIPSFRTVCVWVANTAGWIPDVDGQMVRSYLYGKRVVVPERREAVDRGDKRAQAPEDRSDQETGGRRVLRGGTGVRQIGEITVVDLAGRLTIGAGDVMLRELIRNLLAEGRRQIVINLQRVSYMDAAGIGELVACYQRAKELGGTVRLVHPSARTYDMLQLTKCGEVFEEIFNDEIAAVRSFK